MENVRNDNCTARKAGSDPGGLQHTELYGDGIRYKIPSWCEFAPCRQIIGGAMTLILFRVVSRVGYHPSNVDERNLSIM